jgi:glycosyltransferase involved in cell wall biosynthesis
VKEAGGLVKAFQVGETQGQDNPTVWLSAFVSLIVGRLEEAKNLAALFAPVDFDSGRPLDETEMLRLWSVARNGMNSSVEDNFPGLAEYQRRNAASAHAAEQSPVAQTSALTCVLTVATEWDSHHGGLSTFNRDLCAALSAAGARVVCYVPQASDAEKGRARTFNVQIVEARKVPGSKDTASLLQRPDLPPGFVPDVVIGHDRITGPASVSLAINHYPGSKRVLFIHTAPEEIEWHKEPREDSSSTGRAEERKKEQLGLARECHLVVAVGPHLASEFGTDLHGAGIPVPLMELTPGLPERPVHAATTLPPAIRCLILGRVEDYRLKGLDLAAGALGRVVANWRQGSAPKLIVRGAPVGTDAELRHRLAKDSAPTDLDIVIRYYSADETEIRNDLREASLVLMPSRKEGFGLVGLEAIACGVPTLMSDQSGLAETVRLHARHLAEEWILPVSGDPIPKWEGRIETLLKGRPGAFARAGALRDELDVQLDWKRAATELLAKVAPPTSPAPAAPSPASHSSAA